ncbi:hypothetical protein L2449_32425 [Mesorhizobium muleiense]|uniref:hypothetical protein n=1 Tax=Mesorhizobium muleiense TaxID=1004279 RepID=UPI001F4732F2|nr:hypothetical protein [Mesorhizobium muleiense]MCF6121528.1 hypothetical protein [Mesorhizobium muleiense]
MPLRFNRTATIFALFLSSTLIPAAAQMSAKGKTSGKDFDNAAAEQAKRYLEEGRETFRFDTFGSEDFWGGKLKLHEAVAGEKLGGKGPGLSPEKALELGLKVDVNAIPTDVAEALNKGEVDLADPASTLVLLRANAVVGVTGFFAEDGKTLTSVGIQCAVCHSTVDDAYAPGIGHRLDGWPNRDLNIGAIVALAPDLTAFTEMLQISEAEVKKAVEAWGPGKFDAELNLDGKAFRPDGKTAATLNPPAFGLAGVNNHTWTGAWGTVSYWNAYVGNLEMHGKGVLTIRALMTPRSIRSQHERSRATSRTSRTGLQPSCQRSISISSRCRHRNRRRAPSTARPRKKVRHFSTIRPNAALATSRRSSRNRAGTCIRPTR